MHGFSLNKLICTLNLAVLFLFSAMSLASPGSNSNTKKLITKSKQVSALILFMGDYKTLQQFDGAVGQDIDGISTPSKDFTSDTGCLFKARFQQVFYRKALHLKINFMAECKNTDSAATSAPDSVPKLILAPEYVRLKDLKVESSGLYLSDRYKNVQFKIIDLKYE